MAPVQQSGNRSASRDRGPSGGSSTRLPADHDRNSVRNGDSAKSADENRGPAGMSKALQGMLKSTTETGDIGLFSIKPPRVPQSVNTPRRVSGPYSDDGMQKSRQFQPYGVPNIDDRRRLPSYARDASSEVISMYETASQKAANKALDDPDYRSYSMTQTYSSYSLSNHRSYASLRSQPDATGLLQRPRSPFAYPARLKRPGFRPSSPALTDGGVIDYSRRAEIDRIPYGANHHTSSPASLYAQKRKPPLSLRPEGNRSTPSLLSQSSPQRRSPSPRSRHRSATPSNDWQRRTGPGSITTSPARSTFSLASTTNHALPAPSTSTTPGKVPPSPLYYDYTEEFDVDEYNEPEVLEPPPPFRIDKTIPEDRPLSSGWTSLDDSDFRVSNKPDFSGRFRNSSSSTSLLQKTVESTEESSINNHDASVLEHPQAPSGQVEEDQTVKGAQATCLNPRDTKIIRLSGLGSGARELSSHVEEAFGLPSSPSFEVLVSDSPGDEKKALEGKSISESPGTESQSVRTSAYSLNTHLGQFPPPPLNLDGQYSEENDSTLTVKPARPGTGYTELPLGRKDYSSELKSYCKAEAPVASASEQPLARSVNSRYSSRLSSLQSEGKQASRPTSSDPGLNEPDALIKAIEDANIPKNHNENSHPKSSSKGLPIGPSAHSLRSNCGNLSGDQRSAVTYSTNSLKGEPSQGRPQEQALKKTNQRHKLRRLEAITLPGDLNNDVPNFSHQIVRKLISHSDTPVLAPKPISPARQLKLKNSVPQLMKALPPLPPDPSFVAVSPPVQLSLAEAELPCRFSHLIPESRTTPPPESQKASESSSKGKRIEPVGSITEEQEPVELDSAPVKSAAQTMNEQGQKTPTPPPKLKLKMKSFSTLRPTSPPESRPWNSEESYPWSTESFTVGLPTVVQEEKAPTPKHPKFKLRITRASNSTLGTVRINRESAESRPSPGLPLRHTKDLFTPSSGIDNIFRQVSRHLHTRKASTNSNYHSEDSRAEPILTSISDQLSSSQSVNSELSIPQESPTSLHAASPTEVRSFFSDDSLRCHRNGRNLRKRLSNLRARIAVPYGAANGTQSHDDITWRDRSRPEVPATQFSKSIPNIRDARASTEARPPRRLAERIHAQKLRAKFTVWLRGAKSAIRARVKSRKANGRGDDEQAQSMELLGADI